MEKNQEITGNYDKTLAAKCGNGTFVGKLNGDVLTFKGIPFAEPPVGKLRWKRPQPLKPSDKVFEAYHFGYQSIQPESCFGEESATESGEDCLTLNVYVNQSDSTKKKAVMVWIHGGGFLFGSSSAPIYDCTNFVAHIPDIVMVSINYRLGICGFVDLSHIEGGEEYPDVNIGLHDQVAALKWVQENIAAFGGDPDRVTIFGESAGGGSVAALTLMEEARGLFKRAIIQSATVALSSPCDTAALPADYLARAFNAKNMEDLLAIPEAELKEYWIKNNALANNLMVNDGKIYRKDPWELYEEGAAKDIDLLIGFMANEFRAFAAAYPPREFSDALFKNMADHAYKAGNDEYKKLYDQYEELVKGLVEPEWLRTEIAGDIYFNCGINRQAEAHAKAGGKCYMYLMNQKCDAPGMGACHTSDLPYLFGTFPKKGLVRRTPEAEALSLAIQQMWSSFAKTGDPSTEKYKWPLYNEQTHTHMIIGKDIHAVDDPIKERRALLKKMGEVNPYLDYVRSFPDMIRELYADHPEMKPEKTEP